MVEKYPVVGRAATSKSFKSFALLTRRENSTRVGIRQGFEFHDVLEKDLERGDDLKIPSRRKRCWTLPGGTSAEKTDIEQYPAAYTARIKAYREYTVSSTPHSCGGFSTKSG